MVNVTQYLKSNGKYSNEVVGNFLRQTRIKYYIGSSKKVFGKRGKGGYVEFSEDLFELFKLWINRIPIPLLNRKEYEVATFIKSYYQSAIPQYKIGDFIFDWFIPCKNLLIEFNENHHSYKKNKDNLKHTSVELEVFIINEKSVMADLATLVLNHPAKINGL